MKYFIITILFCSSLLCTDTIYDKNCVSCHKEQPVELDKLFYRYLLKYSSERATKQALYEYIKKPDYFKSVMPEGYINRFGIKLPTTLTDKKLEEAIDIYWERYKVIGRLE